MGEQATKIRDPIDGSRSHLRAMKAKVAAWVEETRHERSLVGPGAHRMAYSRMLHQNGAPSEDGVPEELLAEALMEAEEPLAPPPVEANPLPARKRPRSDARPAPRVPRHAARAKQRAGGGRSLFAISALAVVFAAAPVGYLVLERPAVEEPPAASMAVATTAELAQNQDRPAARAVAKPAKPSKIVDRVPMEPEPEQQAAEVQGPAKPAAQAAPREALATTVTAMPKQEREAALLPEEVAQTASLNQPRQQPAADERKPAPDPRAQGLFEDGRKLMKLGEVAAARPFFERAAELGHVAALVELARTYDPVALKALKVVGLKPEPDKAIALYDKARMAIGGRAAASGLLGLAARSGQ